MEKKKLTSQQKWNLRHKQIIRADSRRYYYCHKKHILKQQKEYKKRKRALKLCRKKATE